MAVCAHCGTEFADHAPSTGPAFCCRGCEAAFGLITGLGLDKYYERRCLDPDTRPPRPEADEVGLDYRQHARDVAVKSGEPAQATLHLMVEGLHCAACIWLIETVLSREPGVVQARVNMTTRRMTLTWRKAEADPNALIAKIATLGYRLVPFDPEALGRDTEAREKELLRAMAVAGFAAGNIMLFSIPVWAGYWEGMSAPTRALMYWISAMIALPAITYAGRPIFRSALSALAHGRANMDVPISVGVLLATGMSLYQTFTGGLHAYFDASTALLFFILLGRYHDSHARARARSAAEQLVGLNVTAVAVLAPDGARRMVRPQDLAVGMTLLVASGERIGADGAVAQGRSALDTSLLTGESLPQPVGPGDKVFAGTLNMGEPLRVTVGAVGDDTLLAEIVRLMEVSEQGRAKYVALADRVARYYAPVVHIAALATFLGWLLIAHRPWQVAMMDAIAVLIVTCPCALALAVPVVQVVATGRLMRRGILVKSPTALERLAQVDTLVFDKTGTLTLGKPELLPAEAPVEALALAASLAAASRHPLARALCRAVPGVRVAEGVREVPGSGLSAPTPQGEVRLGSYRWAVEGRDDARADTPPGPELWLTRPGEAPVHLQFHDPLRPDAAEVLAQARARGLAIELLSGDREATVAQVAARLGIDHWRAACSPADKCARLDALAREGRRALMVGDGLNDAPALAAAHVSMSPSTAVDISQTAADVIFQGARLAPLLETLTTARRADRLVKQNFGAAILYNAIFVPIAILGMINPLVAAIAMSASSFVVISNALRLAKK